MDRASSHSPSISFHPRRILVRGVNWLGDAVMTTPALLRLREKFPQAHIALLTPDKLKDLWRHFPAVNETISFAAEEGLFGVSRKLKPGKFDLSLVLPNSPRSAMESWLGRIPKRIGYSRPWRNWFLTDAVPARPGAVKMWKPTPDQIRQTVQLWEERPERPTRPQIPHSAHQVYEYLHLAGFLGASEMPIAPELQVADSEISAVRERLRLDPARPCFGINAGAEYGPAKRWPVERFVAVAREVQKKVDGIWLIFGGAGDKRLADRVHSGIGTSALASRNLAGETSLRDLMALLKICRVLLTNDTGPMHVAAALGTPVVVPFGSTSPELTGPGLPGDSRHQLLKSDAPCSPCFLRECPIDFRCMAGITTESVTAAVMKMITQKR